MTTLDKFENKIVSIALKLLDERIDPVDAAMDIMDAVNEKTVNESLLRRADMWYDPLERAMSILEAELPEDAFSDMRAKMASKADDYMKNRGGSELDDAGIQGRAADPAKAADQYLQDQGSGLSMADTSPGAAGEEPVPQPNTAIGGLANTLNGLLQGAIANKGALDNDSATKLRAIIKDLQQYDKMAAQKPGIGMRLKNLFSSVGEDVSEEIEIMHRSGLLTESQVALLESEIRIKQSIVPDLRGIAVNFVDDVNAQQRLREIADQLASM